MAITKKKENIGLQLKSLAQLPVQLLKTEQAKQRDKNVKARLRGSEMAKAMKGKLLTKGTLYQRKSWK